MGGNLSVLAVDPALFRHPLALKAEWTPLTSEGANFQTFFHHVDEHRFAFKPTSQMIFSGFVFMGIGFIPILADFSSPIKGPGSGVALSLLGIICSAFIGLVAFSIYTAFSPLLFDRSVSLLYIGKLEFPITQIAAVQLLRKLQEDNELRSSICYEFNIVLHSGKRINLVTHANLEAHRQAAADLQKFLGGNIDIWDASFQQTPA